MPQPSYRWNIAFIRMASKWIKNSGASHLRSPCCPSTPLMIGDIIYLQPAHIIASFLILAQPTMLPAIYYRRRSMGARIFFRIHSMHSWAGSCPNPRDDALVTWLVIFTLAILARIVWPPAPLSCTGSDAPQFKANSRATSPNIIIFLIFIPTLYLTLRLI